MKVGELIDVLQELDPERTVLVDDNCNDDMRSCRVEIINDAVYLAPEEL